MAHNSSVNFKFIHFLLWIKGSHQILNIETFVGSGESLPNFSCHFRNHNSGFFFQISHHSSVPCKAPLYFFRPNVIYFAQNKPIQVQFLILLSAQVKIHQILVIFETINQFFFNFYITPHRHET